MHNLLSCIFTRLYRTMTLNSIEIVSKDNNIAARTGSIHSNFAATKKKPTLLLFKCEYEFSARGANTEQSMETGSAAA